MRMRRHSVVLDAAEHQPKEEHPSSSSCPFSKAVTTSGHPQRERPRRSGSESVPLYPQAHRLSPEPSCSGSFTWVSSSSRFHLSGLR